MTVRIQFLLFYCRLFFQILLMRAYDCIHMSCVILTGSNLFYATVECVKVVQTVIPLMHAEGNYQWELGIYPGATDFEEDVRKGQFCVVSSSSLASDVGDHFGFCALPIDQNEDCK